MSLTMVVVNNAGASRDNPVIAGFALRFTLAKQSATDSLNHCWVSVAGGIRADLTDSCSESAEEVTVDVTTGTELEAGTPAVLNVVHFTTEEGKHAKVGIYVADQPPNMVTLDGYNADDSEKPLIVPWHVSA